MTIKDNRNSKRSTLFKDLELGTYYEDADKKLCVKISDDSILFYEESYDQWFDDKEDKDAKVYPLKVTLTIEGNE